MRRRRSGQGAPSGAPTIALVHAAGEILEGDNDSPLSDSVNSIYGDVFAKAIREAADDDSVRAILLRVDSPGGSAIASDQILQAVKKARAAGQAGGREHGLGRGIRWLLHRARRPTAFIALPGTLTGSIGVLWGKFAVGQLAWALSA